MTTQEHNQIKALIPDLQPMDHVSLNTKRINFICGQGLIVYNDTYAVEIYLPKNPNEKATYFAVDRHFGHLNKLGEYYRKMPVVKIDDPKVNEEIKAQFDEAIFMNMIGSNNVKEMYNRGLSRHVA